MQARRLRYETTPQQSLVVARYPLPGKPGETKAAASRRTPNLAEHRDIVGRSRRMPLLKGLC